MLRIQLLFFGRNGCSKTSPQFSKTASQIPKTFATPKKGLILMGFPHPFSLFWHFPILELVEWGNRPPPPCP